MLRFGGKRLKHERTKSVVKKNAFGEALRQLRRTRGLSLADLADVIGCSVVHMSDIERGRKNPPRPPKIQALLVRLDAEEKFEKMLQLAAKTRQSVEISVTGKDDEVTNMLAALERRCDEGSMDDKVARKIRAILEEEGS